MIKHTPYDGSHPLFKIGLMPLDPGDWIEVDDRLGFYLSEKRRLIDELGEEVFVAEPGTEAAQEEVLALVADHLKACCGDTHKISADGKRIEIPSAGQAVDLLDTSLPALQRAALLVQEDLIIMRKGEAGWRLAAGSLSFPSSWHLREKFSRPLHDIHETVPGFGPATRNAAMIERIFDNIKVELPMRRFNWSIYSDDRLFHADRTAEHIEKRHLNEGAYLRVEHQTLRKLPKSGDILFTVRIHLDPFETLKKIPDRAGVCNGFVSSLKALSVEELAYKGLSDSVEGLIRRIEVLAKETENQ